MAERAGDKRRGDDAGPAGGSLRLDAAFVCPNDQNIFFDLDEGDVGSRPSESLMEPKLSPESSNICFSYIGNKDNGVGDPCVDKMNQKAFLESSKL